MHILLAAATTVEIQPTLDFLLNRRSNAATGSSSPNPSPHRISTLITGAGSLPTAWSLMRQIDRDRPDLIIQAGIAGSFTGKPHGHLFAIRDEALADLGVWEDLQFKSLFDLGLAHPDQSPFSKGLLVNPYLSLLRLTGLEPASSLTVNEVSTDAGRIAWYRENTNAAVESMEGGALHYIGLREKIAFLQIRSISNDIGIRDKSRWNIPLSIQRLNDRLIRLLEVLNDKDNSILNAINNAS
jgi:futalosine hydrolase